MAEAITWDQYIKLARRYLATGKLDDVELSRKRSIETEFKGDRKRALDHRGPVSITARTADLNWLDYWPSMHAVREWLKNRARGGGGACAVGAR